MMTNLEAQSDLSSIEAYVRSLHHHQLQMVLALKEISRISPALCRAYCDSQITAENLRKIDHSKLLTLAGASKPAAPLLRLRIDSLNLKVIDEVHDDVCPEALSYASEFLTRG